MNNFLRGYRRTPLHSLHARGRYKKAAKLYPTTGRANGPVQCPFPCPCSPPNAIDRRRGRDPRNVNRAHVARSRDQMKHRTQIMMYIVGVSIFISLLSSTAREHSAPIDPRDAGTNARRTHRHEQRAARDRSRTHARLATPPAAQLSFVTRRARYSPLTCTEVQGNARKAGRQSRERGASSRPRRHQGGRVGVSELRVGETPPASPGC